MDIAGLVPVDELEATYTRAHVAVDLMRRNPERELAFASRTVHYLWCGLPVIHSRFSEVAALIEEYEAGWMVDPDDAAGIRAIVRASWQTRRKPRGAAPTHSAWCASD